MQEQITFDIPGDIKLALDEAVRSEGISSNELVGRALKQYLFLRRFRLLSDRMTAKAQIRKESSPNRTFLTGFHENRSRHERADRRFNHMRNMP